jgi:hypothetical protein
MTYPEKRIEVWKHWSEHHICGYQPCWSLQVLIRTPLPQQATPGHLTTGGRGLSLRVIGTGLDDAGEDTIFRINFTENVGGVKLHILGGPLYITLGLPINPILWVSEASGFIIKPEKTQLTKTRWFLSCQYQISVIPTSL